MTYLIRSQNQKLNQLDLETVINTVFLYLQEGFSYQKVVSADQELRNHREIVFLKQLIYQYIQSTLTMQC